MWAVSLLYKELEEDLHFELAVLTQYSLIILIDHQNAACDQIEWLLIYSSLPCIALGKSEITFSLILQMVTFSFSFTRSQFSIRLKTRSSHGMIFYVSDQEENDFMTLFLAHGRLVFMFNVGHRKLKIRSQEKYNDGLWHDVS